MMRWQIFLALVAVALLSGCASQHRAPLPASAKGDRYSGHWRGTWKSEATGHRGKLDARFAKESAGRYRADFHAQWSIFSGAYTVPFNTEERGGKLHFAGQHTLPAIFGGVYRYEGETTPTHFQARYRSAADHGVFTMEKLPSPKE